MDISENRMIEENQKFMENKFYNDILPLNRSGWLTTEMFIKSVVDLLLQFIQEINNPNTKVINFHHPTELIAKLDLRIPINPTNLQKVLEDCKEVLKYQVRTGHPRFFNQLSTGLDLISMIGEWLTATVNTNMFTYEISPVFVLMEKEIIETMCEIVGWPSGKRDGIFSPGGAISNLYAVNAARHYMFPRCKAIGMVETPNLAMFTSEDSHYSIRGAAALVGIGVDNCFPIPVDEKGKMIPSKLEEEVILAKKNGYVPFFVCAVGGTTVYGAFDPINEIANICKKYRMWLHVDAAWGGGILLSKKHRHLANGIERADSVTWNPHKLMGALLQCSACLIRHEGLLFQCNQMCADYLFQQDKPYDVSYDSGDKAIQCGRHNDVFKLWIMWRAKGMNGFEQQVNRLMDLANYFTEKIKKTPGYELIMENVAPKIKAKMMSSGSTMVGYQPDKDKPNFFRMIISNPATTYEDLDFFIEEIIRLGESL
ncbi:Glutamate decarboxylase 1 [Trichinella pseudospiralis]|uniref:Glutamate decarboxylase 1 n=1 Tax=Trichinella pseudospiralis TaxID=6337 RepID=A0A0V1F125_TRIPS|nr:Glutamate decarboxylase 1 [Trichinella pseudospiralis]